MRFKKSGLGGLAMWPLVGLLSFTGNSGVLAAPLEDTTLTATDTVEKHLAAAKLYENKARELEAEAAQLETAVAKVGPDADPEGIRRDGLRAAAQHKRADAKEMEELHIAHIRQANAFHGQVHPQ